DTFEPGSTAKTLTIAAALDSGKITGNESYDCQGKLAVSGHNIKCNRVSGHGILSVSGALEQSCNVALMKIAAAMGTDTFMKYLTNFNIGLKTNVDLAGEARTASLVYEPQNMVASDLAISSFGQGYNVTMMQIASAFCSVINGGYYMEPHVVREIRNAEGVTVQKNDTRVLKQVISSEVSEKMRGYLAAVCTKGTGKTAVPSGYLIGGKTGTAETVPRKQGNYVVSFIGFAPVDDPQVVVYAVVDRPNVADQPHSTFAQELVRDIFTEILPYMNIFRTEELSEEQIEELTRLGIIPGGNIEDAQMGEDTGAQDVETQPSEGNGQPGEVQEEEERQEEEQQTGGDGSSPEEEGDAPYETDTETGYLIEPDSGLLINPDTMEYVDPTISLFD
ncbi:MAG: peptidoglycan glycosyltransferase, partial [Lachnospiraceae bacterium]|nr:peptidoglycan glycosyltransferase [Lachnospiraceae bacterium]